MAKTSQVEIVGQYTYQNASDADRGEVDVRIDRLQASFLNDTPTPYNWHPFCDAVDEALVPMTEGKKFFVSVGQVLQISLITNGILSVVELIVLDTEWFNKIIETLGIWTFLPLAILFVTVTVDTFMAFIFMFKHNKYMAELIKVTSEYSDQRVRYEVGYDYEGTGRKRHLLCFYILVHLDDHSQMDVEHQPIGVGTLSNGGLLSGEAADTGNRNKNNSPASPTIEYNRM